LNADVLQRLHANSTPREITRYDVKHAKLNRKIALDKPIKTSKVKTLTDAPEKRFEVARGKTAEWVEF